MALRKQKAEERPVVPTFSPKAVFPQIFCLRGVYKTQGSKFVCGGLKRIRGRKNTPAICWVGEGVAVASPQINLNMLFLLGFASNPIEGRLTGLKLISLPNVRI